MWERWRKEWECLAGANSNSGGEKGKRKEGAVMEMRNGFFLRPSFLLPKCV